MSDTYLWGTFADGPVGGLHYRTVSTEGITDARGRFRYRANETVTFSIGSLQLGVARGQERLTPAHLVSDQAGSPARLSDPRVINRARLLHSLARCQDFADGIVVDDRIRESVDRAAGRIDLDATAEAFESNHTVTEMLAALDLDLRTAAEARNHLRRTLAGIKLLRAQPVPTRDGSYLLADIFRPLGEGRWPAVIRITAYGREHIMGSACSHAERLVYETQEDQWFEHPDDPLDAPKVSGLFQMFARQRVFENVASVNAFDWVPRGYVVVRIDPRGIGSSPGVLAPYSAQERADFYDAIQWAAGQNWCDGNVGLAGASYAANTQWTVAALRPPALKAIIPWCCDVDTYRELAYPGGILLEGYRRAWWDGVRGAQCGQEAIDLVGALKDHPFDDPAFYGPEGRGTLSADLSKINLPFMTAVSQVGLLHGRGGIEAFVHAPAKSKRLFLVDENYFPFLYKECLEDQIAFFDHFLKGVQNDAPHAAPVKLIMRTGRGRYEWREESTWPLPGTSYREFYLDAAETPRLSEQPSRELRIAAYSALIASDGMPQTVSFVSEPLLEELEIAGHVTATLWVSSTSFDMDVFASLRVLDESGHEVHYEAAAAAGRGSLPVTSGCLKVSHRVLDPARTTPERPWHTHRASDYAPLRGPDDVVEIVVELLPATARVPKGCRLRVDVQPSEAPVPGSLVALAQRRSYDADYHDGAENRVHTGPNHPSRIRLPIVPRGPSQRT